MAQLLNLGKVVGNNATINGKEAIEITGINDTEVITNDDGTVNIDSSKVVTKDRIVEGLGYNPSEVFSNPNLLVNPDFKINQRGLNEYTGVNVYLVDRWFISQSDLTDAGSSIAITSDGIIIKNKGEYTDIRQFLTQSLEEGEVYTLSIEVNGETYSGSLIGGTYGIVMNIISHEACGIYWSDDDIENIVIRYTGTDELHVGKSKLEKGSIATPFVPPNPAEELLKCGIPDDTNAYGYRPTGIGSNPNLLDNPDFKINQRGKSEYLAGTAEYCVDRWIKNTEVTLNVIETGISMSFSGTTNPSIYQRVEHLDILGKTVTFSACINGKIYSCTGTLPEEITTGKTHVAFARLDGDNAIPNVNSIPHIRIQILDSGKRVLCVLNNISTCEWAKLELGSVATPFTPPNPALELIKIQSMNDDGVPKLVSNDTLPTLMNSQMVSNPNLLINPDFKINQRGKSEYTEANTYTVDRWKLAPHVSAGSVGKVSITDNGITLTSGGTILDIYLRQAIENGAEFIGKTVTLSIKAESVSGEWAMGQFAGDNSQIIINSDGIASVTFQWTDNDFDIFGVQIWNRSADAIITGLKWIKLELGSVATPFTLPDPATELAKCQRYFQRIIHTGDETMTIGEAHPTTSNNLKVVFEHVTAMRTAPTVTLSAITDIKYADATVPITDLSVLPSPTAFSRNGCLQCGGAASDIIGIRSTRVNFTGTYEIGHPYMIYIIPNGYIDFSAEL